MRQPIVSPFLGTHLVLRPGQPNAIRISPGKYEQLQSIGPDELCPSWLGDAVMKSWGIDIGHRPLRDFAIVRAPSLLGYGRASYELNLGCNYVRALLPGPQAVRRARLGAAGRNLLAVMRAGRRAVAAADRRGAADRPAVHGDLRQGLRAGMMIEILTNGSRLFKPGDPRAADLAPDRCSGSRSASTGPARAPYDGLTRRRGSFRSFARGLSAARARRAYRLT